MSSSGSASCTSARKAATAASERDGLQRRVIGLSSCTASGSGSRLHDFGLPDDGVVVRVMLFQVGVEVGPLNSLVVIVGLGMLLVIAGWVTAVNPPATALALSRSRELVAAAVMSFPK